MHTSILYPDLGGDKLDSHRAFTVHYKAAKGHDTDLNYHFDNAEVTLNVSLGTDYDEGSLYFGPMRQEQARTVGRTPKYTEVSHRVGYGILHRGQHMHGAMPISYGERKNLIIWMRSSAVRNELCPMCDKKPQFMKTEGPGDGFTVPQQLEEVDACSII